MKYRPSPPMRRALVYIKNQAFKQITLYIYVKQNMYVTPANPGPVTFGLPQFKEPAGFYTVYHPLVIAIRRGDARINTICKYSEMIIA
jgi:hypothetical protein